MLKITPDPNFKADVKITVPGVENPVPVKLVFRYMNRPGMMQFLKEEKDNQLSESLAKIIIDWEGFDEKFSLENLSIFLDNYPAASLEIFRSYKDLLIESRVKN